MNDTIENLTNQLVIETDKKKKDFLRFKIQLLIEMTNRQKLVSDMYDIYTKTYE